MSIRLILTLIKVSVSVNLQHSCGGLKDRVLIYTFNFEFFLLTIISHIDLGSLIDPYWILTAAHCLKGGLNPGIYRALFGAHNKDRPENTKAQLIAKVIRHPLYNPTSAGNSNDIALFKLLVIQLTH
jgi:hypothetical protein